MNQEPLWRERIRRGMGPRARGVLRRNGCMCVIMCFVMALLTMGTPNESLWLRLLGVAVCLGMGAGLIVLIIWFGLED